MTVYFVFFLMFSCVLGASAGRVVVTLYALGLGAPPFAIGILATTYALCPMLLSWVGGRLSDRFGSRWLLMFGASGTTFGMLVPYFVPGLPAVFVAGLMSGLALAFFGVSTQNMVGLLSEPHQRTRNFSNYSLVTSGTIFLGPLCGGFAIDHFGFEASFLVLAALSLLPIILLAGWGGLLPRGTRHTAPSGGMRDMVTAPGVRKVLSISALLHSGQDVFQFYMPVYAHSLGLSASAIGTVLSMNAAAAFTSRLILTRMISRFSEERVLAYAFFLAAASLTLVPFIDGGMLLAVAAFTFGLGNGCGQPIVTMLTFSNAVEGRSGEALGLRMTVNHLTRAVGPVVFGSIGSAFGLPPIFWVNALMLVSGGILSHSSSVNRESTLS